MTTRFKPFDELTHPIIPEVVAERIARDDLALRQRPWVWSTEIADQFFRARDALKQNGYKGRKGDDLIVGQFVEYAKRKYVGCYDNNDMFRKRMDAFEKGQIIGEVDIWFRHWFHGWVMREAKILWQVHTLMSVLSFCDDPFGGDDDDW